MLLMCVFFTETATTASDTSCPTLSLHYALPMSVRRRGGGRGLVHRRWLAFQGAPPGAARQGADERWPSSLGTVRMPWGGSFCTHGKTTLSRSEEHTSELQSLMRISYAVFCRKTKQK